MSWQVEDRVERQIDLFRTDDATEHATYRPSGGKTTTDSTRGQPPTRGGGAENSVRTKSVESSG